MAPPTGRTGIVAGSGALPVHLAHDLRRAGQDPFIVRVAGEADDAYAGFDQVTIPIEGFGRLVPALKGAGVTEVTLAGGISRRPVWHRIRWTFPIFRLLPRAVRALGAGDDALLRLVVNYLESEGIRLRGAHELMPGLLTPDGIMGRHEPLKKDWDTIRAGIRAAHAIGALDAGQAVVVFGTRAVALEGIEGTEGMLKRTRTMRDHGRIASTRRGVLVKCAKPGQELRTDLPSIGPKTVEDAAAAGLSGIAVEAGRSIILDMAATIANADRLGLFLVGVRAAEDGQ